MSDMPDSLLSHFGFCFYLGKLGELEAENNIKTQLEAKLSATRSFEGNWRNLATAASAHGNTPSCNTLMKKTKQQQQNDCVFYKCVTVKWLSQQVHRFLLNVAFSL